MTNYWPCVCVCMRGCKHETYRREYRKKNNNEDLLDRSLPPEDIIIRPELGLMGGVPIHGVLRQEPPAAAGSAANVREVPRPYGGILKDYGSVMIIPLHGGEPVD